MPHLGSQPWISTVVGAKALVALSAFALSVGATAQVTLYDFGFDASAVVSAVGDLNGDGIADLASGGIVAQGGWDVIVRSGRDGAELRRFPGGLYQSPYGTSIVPVGDFDGDGISELLTSSGLARRVQVYSVATGTQLLEVVDPFSASGPIQFGRTLAALGDIDADGTPDFFASSNYVSFYGWPGTGYAISGATGQVLWTADVACTDALTLPDLDGDGVADLAVGRVGYGVGSATGVVEALSGRTGAALWSRPAPAGRDFGWSIAACEDLDGDGLRDLIAGAPDFWNYGSFSVWMRVFVLSSASGAVLREVGDVVALGQQLFGAVVVSPGDYDRDGVGDFAAGWLPGFGATGLGLRIYSGASGALLDILDSTNVGIDSHDGIAFLGDLNGDGHVELALSRPTRVWSLGVERPKVVCVGSASTHGCIPTISASSLASLSIGDNFVLRAESVPNQRSGALLWSGLAATTPFASGRLCVDPSAILRERPLSNSGGSSASANDCSGSFEFHFGHALMAARGLAAGTTLHAQFLYRDPAVGPRGVALTPALRFDVFP